MVIRYPRTWDIGCPRPGNFAEILGRNSKPETADVPGTSYCVLRWVKIDLRADQD
jgi:hypothetical protein